MKVGDYVRTDIGEIRKIITLGDIFKNIETEEKAFEFLNYIQNLQQENKRLKNMLEQADNKNLELIEIINEIYDVIEDKI